MEKEGVYFHNVSELVHKPYQSGLHLQRFPQHVRNGLSEKGRTKAIQSNGCELRFVTESKHVRVTVGSNDSNGRVVVCRGDFFHSQHFLQAGTVTTLHLEEPERFTEVSSKRLNQSGFSSNVWRLHFDRFGAVFYDVDAFGCEVRTPRPDEVPKLTMLAYGSSISQSAGSTHHFNGYLQQTARRLGVDVLNLALSGSCYCEDVVADHLAEREDWDFLFLELGVNMRAVVSPEEFKRRVSYMLDRVIENHPDKPVFVTTIYPNRATYFLDAGHLLHVQEGIFNEVLLRYCESNKHPQLHLLDGASVMRDLTSLTSDLIHPSDYGHTLMSEHLAKLLRPMIEPLRTSSHSSAVSQIL
ncbi:MULTISPECIES: SGNH/GDSL hydrolase family protein [Paenibacillus]|uniref:SGNH/GDSL hydrolase family protein n=1 Tax=Paenibacillus TaxID=44249 RepID=UPI00096F8BC9|nr:GDSL-type esterase/lipase family protein [Paenibacillus odorifer]OMD15566.1 lipase [Paenibacillus odorifer]